MTHRWHCLQQRIADYTVQCKSKFVEIDGLKSQLNVRTILIMELFPFSIQFQFVPHIAQTIFTCMDTNNRLKCRQVSTEWKQCIDTKTNLWSGVSTLNYIKAAEEGRLDICKVCSSVFSASTLSSRGGHTNLRNKIYFFFTPIRKAHEYFINLRREHTTIKMKHAPALPKLGLL